LHLHLFFVRRAFCPPRSCVTPFCRRFVAARQSEIHDRGSIFFRLLIEAACRINERRARSTSIIRRVCASLCQRYKTRAHTLLEPVG
jgi:hypothetical protein